MTSLKGSVAWFNNAKGFGFLRQEDAPDVFVHYSAIEAEGYKSLKEGEPVAFEVAQGSTGRPQAVRVRRLSEGG